MAAVKLNALVVEGKTLPLVSCAGVNIDELAAVTFGVKTVLLFVLLRAVPVVGVNVVLLTVNVVCCGVVGTNAEDADAGGTL